jgi:transcriptional regulator with XRE-family HTH domain
MPTDHHYLAEFLRARRELLQPEEVDIPRDAQRRVRGLRREEVASRAGISVEYYLRLEQGRDHQPSEQVLAAIARALMLDGDATAYLQRLAQPVSAALGRTTGEVSGSVRRLLGQWAPHTPAYVSDANHDILAVNDAARNLAPGYLEPGRNLLLDVFEHAGRAHSDADWARTAQRLTAALRFHAHRTDLRYQQILGELSTQHRTFRRIWALHEARRQTHGTNLHHIEPIGWVELQWQTFEVPAHPVHFLTTFFAEENSPGDEALRQLVRRVEGSRIV